MNEDFTDSTNNSLMVNETTYLPGRYKAENLLRNTTIMSFEYNTHFFRII